MQNESSRNLLDVGVDLDKMNNYNYYLFRDNVVLPECKKNKCKRTKLSSCQLLLSESSVFTDSWLGCSRAGLCKKCWKDFNKITARKWLLFLQRRKCSV